MSNDQASLERIAEALLGLFDVTSPPVPIEYMLQHPRENMWEVVDISLVSGSFMNMNVPYKPRMSLTRVLARLIAGSEWGKAMQVSPLTSDPDAISRLARAIVMPHQMLMTLPPSARNAKAISEHFEVPISEAESRLHEVGKLK
ncbi:MAG: hypothetical protein KME04_03615 [Pleurocapsa minor GSE-CHR-MK-17-07R]|jgi:hypothetical protein|nr:hypothetical protein [Pleurocapsa minor GSE-CHR-MK 17-07R]